MWLKLLVPFTIIIASCTPRSDTIRYLTSETLPLKIKPALPIHRSDLLLVRQLWTPLVYLDSSGKLKSDLAQSWSSLDGKKWVFILKPNLKWSDGTALTAKQIAFSIRSCLRTEGPYSRSVGIEKVVSHEDSVVLELKKGSKSFVTQLGTAYFPVYDVKKKEISLADPKVRYSGPYKVDTYKRGMIKLVSNPFFSRPGKRLKISIEQMESDQKVFDSLLSGKAELGKFFEDIVPKEKVEKLEKANFSVTAYPLSNLIGMFIFTAKGHKQISKKNRQFLLRYLWEEFEKKDLGEDQTPFGVQRVGEFGSLSLKEWKTELIKLPKKPESKIALEIFVSSRFRQSKILEKVFNLLNKHPDVQATKRVTEVSNKTTDELKMERSKSDLYRFFVFYNDPNPDLVWRFLIGLQPYAGLGIDVKLLNQALFFPKEEKTLKMYKELERQAILDPFVIPLERMRVFRASSNKIGPVSEFWAGILLDFSKLRLR